MAAVQASGLYLGRPPSGRSSFTSTSSIRSVASVVPMGAGKRRWLDEGMNSGGEPRVEVSLDNPRNDNPPPLRLRLQGAPASVVLPNHCPAPRGFLTSQVGKQRHGELSTPTWVWSLNARERPRLQLRALRFTLQGSSSLPHTGLHPGSRKAIILQC